VSGGGPGTFIFGRGSNEVESVWLPLLVSGGGPLALRSLPALDSGFEEMITIDDWLNEQGMSRSVHFSHCGLASSY